MRPEGAYQHIMDIHCGIALTGKEKPGKFKRKKAAEDTISQSIPPSRKIKKYNNS